MTTTPFQYLTGRVGFVFALMASLAIHSFVLVGLIFLKTPVSYSDIQSSLNYTLVSTPESDSETHSIDNAMDSSITATLVSGAPNEPQPDELSNASFLSEGEESTQIHVAESIVAQSRDSEISLLPSSEDPVTTIQTISVDQRSDGELHDAMSKSPERGAIGNVAAISEFIEQQNDNGRAQGYSRVTRDHSPEAKRYIEAFTQKVRRIGQVNYPEEAASRRLHGSLSLAITIDATGRLASAKVIRSSNHEVLDSAALRIIELGAPYAPLPRSLRNSKSQLEFVQNWSFRERILLKD